MEEESLNSSSDYTIISKSESLAEDDDYSMVGDHSSPPQVVASVVSERSLHLPPSGIPEDYQLVSLNNKLLTEINLERSRNKQLETENKHLRTLLNNNSIHSYGDSNQNLLTANDTSTTSSTSVKDGQPMTNIPSSVDWSLDHSHMDQLLSFALDELKEAKDQMITMQNTLIQLTTEKEARSSVQEQSRHTMIDSADQTDIIGDKMTDSNMVINYEDQLGQLTVSTPPPIDRRCSICDDDLSNANYTLDQYRLHIEGHLKKNECNRVCPMCQLEFANTATQKTVETHVNCHFGYFPQPSEAKSDNAENVLKLAVMQ